MKSDMLTEFTARHNNTAKGDFVKQMASRRPGLLTAVTYSSLHNSKEPSGGQRELPLLACSDGRLS